MRLHDAAFSATLTRSQVIGRIESALDDRTGDIEKPLQIVRGSVHSKKGVGTRRARKGPRRSGDRGGHSRLRACEVGDVGVL